MTSHESHHSNTRFDTHQTRRENQEPRDAPGRQSGTDASDLGIGASDRTVSITLGLGVGLMLLVLLLPYLGGG